MLYPYNCKDTFITLHKLPVPISLIHLHDGHAVLNRPSGPTALFKPSKKFLLIKHCSISSAEDSSAAQYLPTMRTETVSLNAWYLGNANDFMRLFEKQLNCSKRIGFFDADVGRYLGVTNSCATRIVASGRKPDVDGLIKKL